MSLHGSAHPGARRRAPPVRVDAGAPSSGVSLHGSAHSGTRRRRARPHGSAPRVAAVTAPALPETPPRRRRDRALALDLAVYRAVRTRLRGPATVRASRGLSRFGEHALGWLALGAAGAALDRSRRADWAAAAATVAAAHAANVAVKRVVRRARPDLEDLPALTAVLSGHSFPSAHACSSAAAAVAYGRLVPRTPLAAAAAAMALSRVVVGVHYPGDVLAGAALGTAVARSAQGLAARSGTTDRG